MPLLKTIGSELYHRVILSYRSTLIGILCAAGIAVIDSTTTYLQSLPKGTGTVLATLAVVLGAAVKKKLAERVIMPAALALLVGSVLFAAPARADAPVPSQYGGCNKAGTFCYGPALSLSLVGLDLRSGKFTAGIIPGAGYGMTFFADKPYQLGVGGYAAIQSGPETTSGMFSGIVSFAQYVRTGVGWQIVGGSHATLLMLGLGADLK